MRIMTGHDRAYRAPRSLRARAAEIDCPDETTARVASGTVVPWDLFELERRGGAEGTWARSTMDGIIASIDAEQSAALGCTDCEDTGFYGLPASGNPDLLTALVQRRGDDAYEQLTADGTWQPWAVDAEALEVLSLDLAGDLAEAIVAGSPGLLRRYVQPRTYLAPGTEVQPISAAVADASDDWQTYGIVDDDDTGAVLDFVRVRKDHGQRWDETDWVDDPDLLDADGDLLVAALVADAPLTVSPDPRAEKLRRYWSSGKGAAKIRWGTPGDWKRCYRHLRKYMGLRAKGYCQNLHKRNNSFWTGDRRNRGLGAASSPESFLLASVRAGHWTGPKEGTDMSDTAVLPDGVYSEAESDNDAAIRTLVAGGFPVTPPDEWYADPALTAATPLTVEDSGRVFGHIATWDTPHTGYQDRKIYAPRSRANYAFFTTGQVVTASGKKVNVGQLTLAGGHASMQASHAQAVAHYDSTGSGVADVAAGEDKFGIWVAGSLRSTVTPEQLRVLRASAPSGDWRNVNGSLELVAICQVNVPGFPVARQLVAAGAVVAMVAAGARPLAEARQAERGDSVLLARFSELEAKFDRLLASVEAQTNPVEVIADPAVADAVVAEEPVGVVETADGVEHVGEVPAEAAVETAVAVEEPVAEAEPVEDPAAKLRAEFEALQMREEAEALAAAAHSGD